jgi:hypothetical protein
VDSYPKCPQKSLKIVKQKILSTEIVIYTQEETKMCVYYVSKIIVVV